MTTINSSLSKADDGTALVNAASMQLLVGTRKLMSRATFVAAMAAERTRISQNGSGIYPTGEEFGIYGEEGIRSFDAVAGTATTVTLRNGFVLTVAEANTVLPIVGVPASNVDATGAVRVDNAAGIYYVKSSGGWTGTAFQAAASSVVTPTLVTTSTYTLLPTDKKLFVSQACVITNPGNLPSTFECAVVRMGTGAVSITGGTIVTPNGKTSIDYQYTVGVILGTPTVGTLLCTFPSVAAVTTPGSGSSGDSGSGWTEPNTVTAVQASRLLHQAAFGANPDNIAAVQASGLTGWVDTQLAMPAQRAVDYLYQNWNTVYESPHYQVQNVTERIHARFLYDADKLRNRVVAALASFIVVSNTNGQISNPNLAYFADCLFKNAFGNFKDVLVDMAHTSAMANYLTYLKNEGQPVSPVNADENFAREIMQLFTIGLNELNIDGSEKTYAQLDPSDPRYDPNDHDVCPTYDQFVVKDCAKIWTGLSYGPPPGVDYRSYIRSWSSDPQWIAQNTKEKDMRSNFYQQTFVMGDYTKGYRDGYPLMMFGEHHNLDAKTHLIGGLTIPAYTGPKNWYTDDDAACQAALAGMDAYGSSSVAALLDALFNHPNVGPFVAVRMIKMFIKSNPSPAYIARVATKFNDNGSGVRGDMKAVIRQVLLDVEARDESYMSDPNTGKIREPMWHYFTTATYHRLEQKFHNNEYHSDADYLGLDYLSSLKQQMFSAPSVFYYFPPDYRDPTLPTNLTSPEAKMLAESSIIEMLNNPSARTNWDDSKAGYDLATDPEYDRGIWGDGANRGLGWLETKYFHQLTNGKYADGTSYTEADMRVKLRALADEMNLYLAAGQIQASDLDDLVAALPNVDALGSWLEGSNYPQAYYRWVYNNLEHGILQNPSYMVLK